VERPVWTQRDQIQAYQFLRRRLVSALVSADANHPVPPARRLAVGTGVGLAVTFLVAAVFGIIGLLAPARAAEWRQGGQVIIEKETGARYVLGADGLLHPMANYASARLLAGGDGQKTVVVPAKTLRDVPRGPALGIVGAPDSLPRLISEPWTSCSRGTPDRPDDTVPEPVVVIGHPVAGRTLGTGEGFVARLPSGERFLVTEGRRYRLADDRAVIALGYAGAESVPVAAGWLNTIPAGRDLTMITVAGAGRSGPVIAGRRTAVGQVLVARDEYFVVRADGLAVITETEARLISTTEPVQIPVGAVPGAPAGSEGGYPARHAEPIPVSRADSICATGEKIMLGASLPPSGVVVPGGAGALVTEDPSGTVYLVTDTGLRHPIAGEEAIKALGFGAARRQSVPAALLALVPAGPGLDPAGAAKPLNS
jgi:type VII secretion protein EccB